MAPADYVGWICCIETMYSRELAVKEKVITSTTNDSDALRALLSEFNAQAQIDAKQGVCAVHAVLTCHESRV